MGPEDKQQGPAWQLPQGGHTFSGDAALVLSDRRQKTYTTGREEATSSEVGRGASSTGKEDSPECRGSISPASSGSSHVPPPQLTGSHSFLIDA